MQILPISQNQNNQKFKANARWIKDKNGQNLYKATTYYFRDDIEWGSLIKYLCRKYEKAPKVNVINHACSCGMEPLSFIMSLLTHASEYISKFTPVIAKDIDAENIKMAKTGLCGVSMKDFSRINECTLGRFKDFLNIRHSNGDGDLFIMSPKKILTDNVIFEKGDIFEDIEKMPKDNTVLFCRNLWMYLPHYKQKELAARLGNHFSSGSTVIVGYLDAVDGMADDFLQKYGFQRCPIGNRYKNIMYSKI